MVQILIIESIGISEGIKSEEHNEKLQDAGAFEMPKDHESSLYDDASKVDNEDSEI